MKYSFKILAIIALALLATSCYFRVSKNAEAKLLDAIRGDGNVIDKEYTVKPFNKIENQTGLNVIYVQDSSTTVRIHADSNIVALLDVSVEDSTLTVRKDETNLILEGDKYIYIACPSVRSVIGRGSGNFNTENFKLESLKINLSGSGNIFMKNGSLDGLEVSTSGSGDVEMENITCTSDIFIGTAGSGNINIKGINGQDIVCGSAGSGDISVSGVVKNIKAGTAGSGNIDIRNLKYESKDVSAKGSGEVITE
jgi:hypothetical protein